MIVLGITGGFGTGKTTVAHMFGKLGAKVLDADRMAHDVIRKGRSCYKAVIGLFGKGVLTGSRIDRKKLARIVFNNPRALNKLCAVIHPVVIRDIKQEIQRCKKNKRIKVVVIDAPLLIEAGLDEAADYIIVVKTNRSLQFDRILKHWPLSRQHVQKRIKAQMNIKQKIRLADIVIDNRGSKAKTKKQVEEIWLRLLKRQIKKQK